MKKSYKYFLILLLCISAFSYACIKYNKTYTFTKEKWESNPEYRYKIVKSLTEKYTLVGMSKKEIIELLGENQVFDNNESRIDYLISTGLGDPEFFTVFFDENGFVREYDRIVH